jgi:3-oxoacyl-[acyl-carrier-protein] synthase II
VSERAVDTVVVTGLGAASALGTGIDAHREGLRAGRDGLRPIERFDTSQMMTRLGGMWPGWDGRIQPEAGPDRDLAMTATDFPLHELALVAAREAWAGAGLTGVDPRRSALVFGTCFGQGFSEFHAVAHRIAGALAITGPRITISTACSSSTNAIGLACDLLLRGDADVVVAGGADSLLREAFAGFSALGVLSAGKCAPFSEPAGTTLGEGAGFVVLERAADAARRGAKPWASIHGYGLSADGFHETTPDPSGAGVARAIHSALLQAGWQGGSIDYVSAHATGTTNNDRIEWSVIERELGADREPPPVSGSKSQLGHTQGAAGALELVLSLLCQREGTIPPTLHFQGPRPGCPTDPVAASHPRVHPVARALKLSAAFGGANAVLAYGAPEVLSTRPAPSASSRVAVRGVGIVGPRHPDVDLGRIGVDPRRLDRSARWLTAASVLALGDGGRPLRGEASARTGLFLGATRMPEESSRRCHEAIRRHGVTGTSAAAFARMSVNAPAGACSRALGLLGPTTTVTIGPGSGLLAVVLAAEWLATRDDADRIVAGAVEERRASHPDDAEGAACLVLERQAGDAGGAVFVAGWGLAGPEDIDEASRRALGEHGRADGVVVDDGPTCLAAAGAVADLRAGTARSLLVLAPRGISTVALLLVRGPS